MNMNEEVSGPFVRVVGDGVDVTITVQDCDDIDIAHKAIDLAFERYKKHNEPTITTTSNTQ